MSEIEGLKVRGDAFFNRTENGVSQGWKMIDGVEFSIEPKSTIDKMKGKGKDNYGLTTNSVSVPDDTTFTVSFQNFSAESLALALMGETAVVNIPLLVQ